MNAGFGFFVWILPLLLLLVQGFNPDPYSLLNEAIVGESMPCVFCPIRRPGFPRPFRSRFTGRWIGRGRGRGRGRRRQNRFLYSPLYPPPREMNPISNMEQEYDYRTEGNMQGLESAFNGELSTATVNCGGLSNLRAPSCNQCPRNADTASVSSWCGGDCEPVKVGVVEWMCDRKGGKSVSCGGGRRALDCSTCVFPENHAPNPSCGGDCRWICEPFCQCRNI